MRTSGGATRDRRHRHRAVGTPGHDRLQQLGRSVHTVIADGAFARTGSTVQPIPRLDQQHAAPVQLAAAAE
jgi:hypothetical protein